MKNKDQQAWQYADKQLSDICLMLDYEENKQIGYFHTYDIQKAHIDGYTACEQSDLRISVAKLREILNELASVRGVVNESVDEIINQIKKKI